LQMIGNHRKPGNRDGQIASNSNWAKWPTFSFWPNSGWNLENLWICHLSQVPWGPWFLVPRNRWLSQDESSMRTIFWGENALDPHPLHLGLNIWAWFQPQNFWGYPELHAIMVL
jgi:hypothetical protein